MNTPYPPIPERLPDHPLDEIDRRQDEVLEQLERLNADVEALLEELSARLSDPEPCSSSPVEPVVSPTDCPDGPTC